MAAGDSPPASPDVILHADADHVKSLIKAGMKQVKAPTAGNKVYKDECIYSFTTPFSPKGLFVNLNSWTGCGEQHLPTDSQRFGEQILYFHQRYQRVYKKKEEEKVGGGLRRLLGGFWGG